MASLPNYTTVTCEEWLHLPEVWIVAPEGRTVGILRLIVQIWPD